MTQRVEVGPGSYSVRNTVTGVATNFTVPTLTVAIAQSAPTVGQTLTLTTNAAAGAAYQWRRGSSDISGATSATYAALAADAGQSVSCRVTSGAQVVISAGVTVGAASGVNGTFIDSVITTGGATLGDLLLPTGLVAGQKYVVAISTRGIGGDFDNLGLSVNGTTATRVGQAALHDGLNQSALFEVTPGAAGAALVVSGTGTATSLMRSAHVWSIPNAATFQRFVGSPNTNGALTRDVSVNVTAGQLVIAAAGARSLDGLLSMAWVGVTQDGPSRHANALIAVAGHADSVAAASPRTLTITRGSDTGGFTAIAGVWA